MIGEMRAVRIDLHVRATFAKDGDEVADTRGLIAEAIEAAHGPTEEQLEMRAMRSANRLAAAAKGGFVEVG